MCTPMSYDYKAFWQKVPNAIFDGETSCNFHFEIIFHFKACLGLI